MADHDHSYKLLFSHPEMVRDLLKGFVKADWLKTLDYESLEKMGGSYVTDDLRDRTSDIVWRVRWGKRWIYVYLLLEFQSTIDRYMAVRIMTYLGIGRLYCRSCRGSRSARWTIFRRHARYWASGFGNGARNSSAKP